MATNTTTQAKRTCFFISPIGGEDSVERVRSDKVLRYILRKALEPLGFEVIRADEDNTPGIITTAVLRRIHEADLVVADISDDNPNVFYELAAAHIYNTPAIIIEEGDVVTAPFDVGAIRVINYGTEVDRAVPATERIAAAAKQLLEDPNSVKTPISEFVTLQTALSGTGGSENLLRYVADRVSSLEASITSLSRRVTDLSKDPYQASVYLRDFGLPPGFRDPNLESLERRLAFVDGTLIESFRANGPTPEAMDLWEKRMNIAVHLPLESDPLNVPGARGKHLRSIRRALEGFGDVAEEPPVSTG